MRTKLLFVSSGIFFLFVAAPWLRADQVEMQNGDRYFGRVLSVSADTVTLESELLGKINVPRKKVASLAFGTNAAAPKAATNVAPISGQRILQPRLPRLSWRAPTWICPLRFAIWARTRILSANSRANARRQSRGGQQLRRDGQRLDEREAEPG
jgi:hypothetical protein